MTEEYDILLELQKIDNTIDERKKKIKSLPLKINNITKGIQKIKNNLEGKNENYKNLQLKLRKKELDITEKSNKIKKHQGDLFGGKISDIKELKQLQKVIANYKKEKDNIEEEILILMQEIEDFNKLINNLKEDLKGREKNLQEQKQKTDLEKLKIEKNINLLLTKRKGILKKITNNRLLKSYEVLRKDKGENVIVEVNSNICPGCFLELPSDTIYQLKRGKRIITCPNCSRILIWRE